MAYNREHILERMIRIHNITLEHTSRGVTQEWVYNNIIFPEYLISKATYYKYLSVNAKRDLEILKAKKAKVKAVDDRQLKLF
jgi:hypothetical protein